MGLEPTTLITFSKNTKPNPTNIFNRWDTIENVGGRINSFGGQKYIRYQCLNNGLVSQLRLNLPLNLRRPLITINNAGGIIRRSNQIFLCRLYSSDCTNTKKSHISRGEGCTDSVNNLATTILLRRVGGLEKNTRNNAEQVQIVTNSHLLNLSDKPPVPRHPLKMIESAL